MIYCFKACAAPCIVCGKMCEGCSKCMDEVCEGCTCSFITDRPLGWYIFLCLVNLIPVVLLGGVGAIDDCDDAPGAAVSAGSAVLALLHLGFAFYFQCRLIRGLESVEAPTAEELSKRAGDILLYDVGFCVYAIIFLMAFFFQLLCCSCIPAMLQRCWDSCSHTIHSVCLPSLRVHDPLVLLPALLLWRREQGGKPSNSPSRAKGARTCYRTHNRWSASWSSCQWSSTQWWHWRWCHSSAAEWLSSVIISSSRYFCGRSVCWKALAGWAAEEITRVQGNAAMPCLLAWEFSPLGM
mmetsp:Transcript_31556/g.57997  ORF Transcript_31556/g.57997 Transcript_31556/m.57997 type:complete len:295 (+) Transcript_31556:77-961(+)